MITDLLCIRELACVRDHVVRDTAEETAVGFAQEGKYPDWNLEYQPISIPTRRF